MTKKHQESSNVQKVVAGLGLVAIAAAAAGAIFLYGTDAGKKKRNQIKGWMLRMKGDVMDNMNKMKDWSESSYHAVVEKVAEKYQKMKDVDSEELGMIVKDLKQHWKNLKKHVEGTTKKPAKKKKAPASKPAATV